MTLSKPGILIGWFIFTNLLAFFLFAWDKARASRPGKARISEASLCFTGALGGWPGGLAAMLFFRHKTAKLSFHVKYAVAFALWMGLVYSAVQWLDL